MSSVFQRGMSWHTYLNLERDLIDVTRYVALDKNHGGVWSERIAQLLLLTGSTVDSFFSEMRMSPCLDQFESVIDLRQKPEAYIGDYRRVYEPIYQLSGVELAVRYGLSEYGAIRPFLSFACYNNPEWWIDYNDVKHEFFQNMHKGTLDNLVHALGALFALNVLHMDSKEYLANIGLIRMGNLDTKLDYEWSMRNLWPYLKDSFIGCRTGKTIDCWATSEVFFHLFRSDPKPSS